MKNNLCAKCRRAGTKLFLKGEKCFSPKCPMIKRPFPPGSTNTRQIKLSEYGVQLKEKQKARHTYGLSEGQFKKYFVIASQSKDSTTEKFMEILESRIDNTVFRAGLVSSRPAARQMVSHRLVKLNGKKVNIASILIKKGDVIQLAKKPNNFKISSTGAPSWLALDKKTLEIKINSTPKVTPEELGIDAQLIVEFYNR